MNSMLQRMRGHPGRGMRSGQHPRGVVRFFYAALVLLAGGVTAAEPLELGEIAQLAKGGAAELALKLLDENQPDFAEEESRWLRWERLRVRILEQRGQWSVLASRLETLPEGMPERFRQWAVTRRANALIMSQRMAEARQLLRGLLWQPDEGTAGVNPQWRQLIMQSYLHEGRIGDAYAAMLRFHQDYGDGDKGAALIRARILLASERPGEARSMLGGIKRDTTTELLWQLSRLRSGTPAATVLKTLRDEGEPKEATALQRYLYYGVMAEAAEAVAEPAFVIIALEQWYRLERPAESWRQLFDFGAGMLWQNYLDYALRVGNQEQLLIGNDTAWLKLAAETEKRYPIRKRSLYAHLARKAYSGEIRQRAALELASMLQEQDNGMAVVKVLFLHGDAYAPNQLPEQVAYLLVDQAIREGDLPLASRLLQKLPEPPENTARFLWQLRRVKVFILAGEHGAAESLLSHLIEKVSSYSKAQRDQLVQLLFDLQGVGEHELAYRMLDAVQLRVPDLQMRRELLFWMADSRQAQARYSDAARLYLQSATLLDVKSMDPWAQTARYKAAEALSRAGMLEDAAYLYSRLLKTTEEPERRAVLRRALEQVRMRQAADG